MFGDVRGVVPALVLPAVLPPDPLDDDLPTLHAHLSVGHPAVLQQTTDQITQEKISSLLTFNISIGLFVQQSFSRINN